MTKRTVTALFDSYEKAAEAVRKVEALGISHSDVSIVANNEGDRYSQYATNNGSTSSRGTDDTHADDGAGTGATLGTLVGGGTGLLAGLGLLAIPGLGPVVAAGWLVSTLVGAGAGAAAGGLVGSLVGAGVPEEHAHSYAEGVRRGGTLVTVRADDQYVDRVVDILDDHGSVDMDEREQTWRSSGWKGLNEGSGYTSTGMGAAAGAGAGLVGAAGSTTTGTNYGTSSTSSGSGVTGALGRAADKVTGTVSDAAAGLSGSTDRTTTGTSYGATGTGTDREAIPIVEEQIAVGKREVNRGRVRVHSYVVEQPIQEQVTLREEHVHVDRRPVDRPITDADRLFQERTIEAVERDEQAVVAKEARVKEELVINKEVEQRQETISDTVRRTEVEVEDERGNRISGTGTTGTTDRDRR
ncbi:MAG TPA: YsnF/AvaK domain-containing protein [Beijerinckiaceae bacterium]|jgi:uncharacterized protein (TIGR02271 family)